MTTKNLLVGLIFSLSYFVNTAHAQLKGDSFEQAKSSKKANLTYLFTNTPAFTFVSDDGNYEGISIDIMHHFENYIKSKYGIIITSSYQRIEGDNFPKMLATVKSASGGVFGLGNITITDARKKIYSFSPPFINNISLLVTHKSAPSLSRIEDIGTVFKGMTAYTVKGSTNEIKMFKWKKEYFPDMKISYISSIPAVVKKVTVDPKAFTNVDFTYYLQAIQDKKPVKRHTAGASNSEEFGIIMPKANDWSAVLAGFMNSGFISSAEYKEIIRAHLGESAIKLLESVK